LPDTDTDIDFIGDQQVELAGMGGIQSP